MTQDTKEKALELANSLENVFFFPGAARPIRALVAHIAELEAQLAAIGAGGVEPLRKVAAVQQGVQAVTKEFDASTSKGGRGYVAWHFSNVIGRHDFQSYIENTLAADFACALAKWLATHPTRQGLDAPTLDALQEAESVLNSINMGKQHKVVQDDGEVTYWQREEWCKWATGEVLPKVTAALAAQTKQGGV